MSDELYERATGENDYWCGVCRRIHTDICPDSIEFSKKQQRSFDIHYTTDDDGIHLLCKKCHDYVERPSKIWFPNLFELNEVADIHFRESHSC